MHDNGVTLQKKVLQNLDIPYSYELAKRMEQYLSLIHISEPTRPY